MNPELPARTHQLAVSMAEYFESHHHTLLERLSGLLGAAEVMLRTNEKTGTMDEPTQREKDLAFDLINGAQAGGYHKWETLAALIGVADGIALAEVRSRV